MSDMPPAVKERLKKLHLELCDVVCELQKLSSKIDISVLFSDDDNSKQERKIRIGLVRDVSDGYIRQGSLMRRMCDLIEPTLED